MNVLILQPPVMQLNTAYPSGAYLSDFFKKQNCQTKWLDLNIELFYSIFCKKGVEKIFELAQENALKIARKSEANGDEITAFNLRRYVSQQNLWIDWIEKITDILCGNGFESAHSFCFGAHVPRGNRMENFLNSLDHDLTTDDARSLASFALADFADFINVAFDKNFSLVRYAESLTISESVFSEIEKGADSPILKEFFVPLLEQKVVPQLEQMFASIKNNEKQQILVCISIPFPGVFAAALCAGKFLKQKYGEKVFVSFGGGFVNTELRETKDAELAKYCNVISYDRGYASYKKLLEKLKNETYSDGEPIYNLRQFMKIGSRECVPDNNAQNFVKLTDGSLIKIIEPAEADAQELSYETLMTKSIIPDFTDIDFTRYPRLIDDTNPMHRLWSDGAWIKAYMAHGCYWHKCAFCDVTLDYVKSFYLTDVQKLYEGLYRQCKEKNIWGIHFVDEAMPPAAMLAFARENIAHGSPISWWGNIRFEKNFTRDVADFLSYGGLIGVSAGLESATGNGLNTIHKGTDLESIVGACCAFKEAGVLVHAYMIFGYWFETPQDLINSMETLRQFYANGLLDSCFWHKFVLTRHSRVYDEWKKGEHPELKVIKEKNIPLFAKNGLHFEGERSSEKYSQPLEYSLNEWMHGRGLEKAVFKWFSFNVPKPNVGSDFIAKMIEKYEHKRDLQFEKPLPEQKEKIVWLGGEKIKINTKKGEKLRWFYMGEQHEADADAPQSAFRGRGLCVLP